MKDIWRYFKEIRIEMAKVVWPSFAELIGATIVVLILVAILATFLFGVDTGLKWVAQKVYATYGNLLR